MYTACIVYISTKTGWITSKLLEHKFHGLNGDGLFRNKEKQGKKEKTE
jgi:cobalamin synthase